MKARTPVGSISLSNLIFARCRISVSCRRRLFNPVNGELIPLFLRCSPRVVLVCARQDNGVRCHKLARSLFSRGEEGEKGGG
jgi:hypothetical protein